MTILKKASKLKAFHAEKLIAWMNWTYQIKNSAYFHTIKLSLNENDKEKLTGGLDCFNKKVKPYTSQEHDANCYIWIDHGCFPLKDFKRRRILSLFAARIKYYMRYETSMG